MNTIPRTGTTPDTTRPADAIPSDSPASDSSHCVGIRRAPTRRSDDQTPQVLDDLGLKAALESTGEPLISGVPILIGCDLLEPYALGIGSMLAIDQQAAASNGPDGFLPDSEDAGADDLGKRVIVVFIAPGEVLA